MKKIAFVDTYYPPVLADVKEWNYEGRLNDLLGKCFGTAFYYSDAFRKMGWEAIDIIGNDTAGRKLWSGAAGLDHLSNQNSVLDQLALFEPDIIYMQDLGFFDAETIKKTKKNMGWKWVAQHSCPWAGDAQVGAFDCVFTSFPHYLARIARLNIQTGFLPIAFGHQVLDHLEPQPRHYPVTFVGGVNGTTGHWSKGTQMLEEIADAIPQFKWWGYFIGDGSQYPALQRSYQGEAWGLDMYKIYAQSQMVINRHGEVAQGFSNNMRMFESTGCGALLLTEESTNLSDYFTPGKECLAYRSTLQLIDVINKVLLWNPRIVEEISAAGQARTMQEHTYERRLVAIQPILDEMRAK